MDRGTSIAIAASGMLIDPKCDIRAKHWPLKRFKRNCHRHLPMIAMQCVAKSTHDGLIDRRTMRSIISVMIRR
jgi:hypothetical protein